MNRNADEERMAVDTAAAHSGRRRQLPLRTRLTFWYLLTLAAILALFLAFLYWQMQRTLLAQMDAALRMAATQALLTVQADGDRLAFQNGAGAPAGSQLGDDFAIYLLDSDGAVWDLLGRPDEFSPHLPRPGLRTLTYDGDQWRVFTVRVPPTATTGNRDGWIQVGQEMEAVVETLATLGSQMLLGLPLALLLAGLGGYFLARRALRPIEHITHTAQTITAGDLSRRIDYQGPADEVGRLAETFDGMLERLESAFERQRRFTADAAHELRTPLTALKGRIEVTLNRPRSLATYSETLAELGGQVDRLIRLSSDLLFMARLDRAGRQTVRHEKVELEGLLAAVMDQIRPLAERKEIAVMREIAPQINVEGDLDLLIRLFLNLLDNAVEYTPRGGRVSVTAHTSGESAVVTVSDSGPGISAKHLPHLFERFYRVEEDRVRLSNDERQGGAGLGLAISAEIVRVHGGTIEVESEEGESTTFTVRLPRQR